MISERDYNNILATAREEGLKMGHEEGYDKGLFEGREIGREEGRKEGREEGREEERLDVARKMKDRGISISEISIITGIDKKLIEEL
jgi:predicted transposase YdaD